MRLDGLHVLDLSRLLSGPYATQLLADSGTEIIKIVDTGERDYVRHSDPKSSRKVGEIFEIVNRENQSVRDEGREQMRRRVTFYNSTRTSHDEFAVHG